MNIRPIKTDGDYDAALRRITSLMDAKPGTPDIDELDVLASLVEQYEAKRFPIDVPSPIDAIRFRMEQANLSARDLVPFIGSRARVSEVLSGKRPLTLQMIRALHEHLAIPADALLKQPGATLPETPSGIEWRRYPLNEMAKRGWIQNAPDLKSRAEEIMRQFFDAAGGQDALTLPLYRKNDGARQNARMDPYALQAWCYRVLAIARQTPLSRDYREGTITEKFAKGLLNLSWLPDGPKLAKSYLAEHGIHLIYLPHLTATHLDGAALRQQSGRPIIALTVRYDRVDSFWFCLFHELAHVKLHLRKDRNDVFVDDLSLGESRGDDRESAADQWAQNTLIPPNVWASAQASTEASPSAVIELAQRLRIHPAIVAGRVRKDRHNYRLLTHYVGNGDVRKHFDEE